jgi:hypothetical protein
MGFSLDEFSACYGAWSLKTRNQHLPCPICSHVHDRNRYRVKMCRNHLRLVNYSERCSTRVVEGSGLAFRGGGDGSAVLTRLVYMNNVAKELSEIHGFRGTSKLVYDHETNSIGHIGRFGAFSKLYEGAIRSFTTADGRQFTALSREIRHATREEGAPGAEAAAQPLPRTAPQ